jgi:imidazolonepropionase
MTMWDQLWTDLRVASVDSAATALDVLDDAAIAIEGERIAWIGAGSALPAAPQQLARHVHSGGGRLATAGLIDCHTHLVFGGDRALDFDLRTQGKSYAEIAAAGGGIRSTVAQTRGLGAEALAAAALPRARALLAEGVTTLEVKSGYGLDVESELKMLEAARHLGRLLDVEVVPTLLALHALPPEFAHDRQGYVDLVVRDLIPAAAAAGLAVAVDVFCESIAFTRAECARVLGGAREHGLAVKVHADQLSDLGGAALAAEYGALSADHLEYTSDAGVEALAGSGTVAVMLPGAYLMLAETKRPPVAALRAAGVPMAVATDLNPGTSPCTSLPLAIALARAQFGLTAAEGLAGVTCHAARALGLADSRGALTKGLRADFCLWDLAHPRELGYWLGRGACHAVVRGGRIRAADSLAAQVS